MKFVKENLTLVICAAVALICVALLIYPGMSMVSSFQETMKARMADQASAIKYSKTKLEIPGAEPIMGVPSQKLIEFKQHLIDSVHEGAKNVEDAAASLNAQGRVSKDNFPLLNGEEVKGFVPVLTGEPQEYKVHYGAQFAAWTTLLVGKANTPATPPDPNALKTEYDAMMAAQAATLPPGMAPGGGGMGGAQDPKQFLDYEKRKINARAADIHMYVDPSPAGGSFQIRPWYLGDEPPTEQQIYESLVDSWLQGEVVRAIAQVNKAGLEKVPATERNVAHAPIKRLIHVTVGNNAAVRKMGNSTGMTGMPGMGAPDDPGLQYFMGAAVAGATPPAAPVAGAAPTVNYDFDLTGRSSGSVYDVVLVNVHMELDPAYMQSFYDQLYRQNVGYTILNVQVHTVDPLERISYGYIYGEPQTVEVEIVIEALLLRGWTVPLMPAAVKAQLGVPGGKAAPAGTPAGAPAGAPAATPSAPVLRGN